jgi:hypothetical protein
MSQSERSHTVASRRDVGWIICSPPPGLLVFNTAVCIRHRTGRSVTEG